MEPIFGKVTGEHGTAEPVELPDIPKAAATVASWLLTSESFHLAFHQWLLIAVRLDDIEGFPPAKHHFEGTTHEVLVVTLNPEAGRFDLDRLAPHLEAGDLPHLDPPSVAVQVIAEDAEVTRLLSLLAQGVVHGVLSPESMWTAGYDEALNEVWLAAITKSLAHGRGEVHAP